MANTKTSTHNKSKAEDKKAIEGVYTVIDEKKESGKPKEDNQYSDSKSSMSAKTKSKNRITKKNPSSKHKTPPDNNQRLDSDSSALPDNKHNSKHTKGNHSPKHEQHPIHKENSNQLESSDHAISNKKKSQCQCSFFGNIWNKMVQYFNGKAD